MNGFVQTRCARCGNPAWAFAGRSTPCHTCGAPMPPSDGAAAETAAETDGVPSSAWGPAPPVVHQAPDLGRTALQPIQHANGSGVTFRVPRGTKPPSGSSRMKRAVIAGVALVLAAVVGLLIKLRLR